MELQQKYRLRVESCIGTIIEVHKSVSIPFENESFFSQFEELRKAICQMDMSRVSEQDVLLVEQATNALLCEFTPVVQSGQYNPPHEEPLQ